METQLNSSFDAASKQAHIGEAKQWLEALSGQMFELLAIEVGINFNTTDSEADIALYTEFASREDRYSYQQHPLYIALVPFIIAITEERRVVDYDL